tara:strand:+ start:700 stop:855 length:156 start_codon:yes stop_codon:yes gene_type:complete
MRCNCFNCGTELIWEGDEDPKENEYSVVSVLSCPKCQSTVKAYLPTDAAIT